MKKLHMQEVDSSDHSGQTEPPTILGAKTLN